MKRNVVIDTGCLYRLNDDKKVLDLIKECGFTHFDLTLFWKGVTEHIGVKDDYIEKAKALRTYSDELGLTCEQAHAYFVRGNDSKTNEIRLDYIKKDIKIVSIMGAKGIVVHPVNEFSFEENVEFYKELLVVAKENDIKIYIENTYGFKDEKIVPTITSTKEGFIKLIDTLNDNYIKACLDIGHAELESLNTSAVDMINSLGSRLEALHIHDNNKVSDDHEMPYTNKISFGKILKALKENNYQGNITFEVETCYNKYDDLDLSLPFELFKSFVKLEREIGEHFINYLDN